MTLPLFRPLAALTLAAALAGCMTVPPKEHNPAHPVTAQKALEKMSQEWNDQAVVTEGRTSMVLITPFTVPDDVRAKRVRMELEAGATVKDVVAVLANLGHSIVLADQAAGEKTFFLPRYNGTLGGLLSAITRASDVWFTWHDGVIHVTESEKVTLTMPQEESLAKRLTEGLTSLGVKESAVSWEAGMLTVPLTPSQLDKVRLFLGRMSDNASLISLQVAVVGVSMNHGATTGIDWGGLQLAVGTGHRAAVNASLGGSNTSGSSDDGTAETVGRVLGAMWTGSSLRGVVSNNAFSFVGLVRFLQNYGATETKQNVLLKTVAGNEVKLESVTEIPYVSAIGVTTTGNNSSSNLGSARTSTARDGITLKMLPTFDAAANSVTVTLDLTIDAVLGFTDLKAGQQLGELTQPTVARRSFNDVLRLRPGQTVVVGGITYDSVSNNSAAPIFLSKDWESQSLTVTRQSMFIVVRPSISRLGQVTEADETALFPRARSQDEQDRDEIEKKAQKKADESKARAPALIRQPATPVAPTRGGYQLLDLGRGD